jgi:hypothetical protein
MRSANGCCSALALAASLAACGNSESEDDARAAAGLLSGDAEVSAAVLPAWITAPRTMPEELRGLNNCTFPLRLPDAEWDYHPDGACWERPGPDGWTRQQLYRVHVPQHAACGNGPADVSPIRICQAPGLPNPCNINPETGPNGCAVCVIDVACH